MCKLKRKLSEKRKERPKSGTLKAHHHSKVNSPETKRALAATPGYRQGSKVVVTMEHWRHALEQVRPSVSEKEKEKYQRM